MRTEAHESRPMVVGYVRISTSEQDGSLQRAAARAVCAGGMIELEAISGPSLDSRRACG